MAIVSAKSIKEARKFLHFAFKQPEWLADNKSVVVGMIYTSLVGNKIIHAEPFKNDTTNNKEK